jgi:hypothetical protein
MCFPAASPPASPEDPSSAPRLPSAHSAFLHPSSWLFPPPRRACGHGHSAPFSRGRRTVTGFACCANEGPNCVSRATPRQSQLHLIYRQRCQHCQQRAQRSPKLRPLAASYRLEVVRDCSSHVQSAVVVSLRLCEATRAYQGSRPFRSRQLATSLFGRIPRPCILSCCACRETAASCVRDKGPFRPRPYRRHTKIAPRSSLTSPRLASPSLMSLLPSIPSFAPQNISCDLAFRRVGWLPWIPYGANGASGCGMTTKPAIGGPDRTPKVCRPPGPYS